MPIAFTRVEESSTLLVEASLLLKKDPYSSVARKKLIDGARGKWELENSVNSHLVFQIFVCFFAVKPVQLPFVVIRYNRSVLGTHLAN